MTRILCVDDDKDILLLLENMLRQAGYDVLTAAGSAPGLAAARVAPAPDLILLDVMMPGLSGYEVCAAIQKDPAASKAPVIFLSALSQSQDKMRALSAGGADYLTKPFSRGSLLEAIKRNLLKKETWVRGGQPAPQASPVVKTQAGGSLSFSEFKKYAAAGLPLDPAASARVAALKPADVYGLAGIAGITEKQTARLISAFTKLPYISIVSPDEIKLGVLPLKFAKRNNLIPLQSPDGDTIILMPHPFDFEVSEMLRSLIGGAYTVAITEPINIFTVYHMTENDQSGVSVTGEKEIALEGAARNNLEKLSKTLRGEIEETPVKYVAGKVIEDAVSEGASDIHIEPKDTVFLVRFRINGDLQDFTKLTKSTGNMVIARLKALGGLDIAERRRPQDGAFAFTCRGNSYILRLATTSTNYGESLVMRLVEPGVKPSSLGGLGMAPAQVAVMGDLARQTQGMVLVVGPTGSGKTTTIFSFLSAIDCQRRSLISVEDPIEYRIPHANQQQVNEKAGVSFQALLKSSVRQDPDILFIGEVRDRESAAIALDFSSTGHLTISTLHASNATAAVFRLERLGVSRSQIAESLLAVISQRLIKKLCPHCRKQYAPSAAELEMLSKFTAARPAYLAGPVGCGLCRHTGYSGREAVYEIMSVNAGIATLIRENAPIAEIRRSLEGRGDTMLAGSAVSKVLSHDVALKDAYEKVLAEEVKPEADGNAPAILPAEARRCQQEIIPAVLPQSASAPLDRVLVVDDDRDMTALLSEMLSHAGYKVTVANDGLEAVMQITKSEFALIISDFEMPNMDGMQLAAIAANKKIHTRLIMLSASTSETSEQQALALGAVDYIRKPVKKDVLLLRVKKALALPAGPVSLSGTAQIAG